MSIATELTRIQQAKADIKTAIEAKGVTVPSSATIDTYDDYVSQISGGGGGDTTTLEKLIDRSITSIDIPSGFTSIGNYAFADCDSLSSITIPNSVTSIGAYAFYQCTRLSSVTIPSGITSISNYIFYYCDRLSNIIIPDSVTTIGNNSFYQCKSFTSINIPSGVTSIGANSFRYCTALTSITINATTPPTLGNNTFANTNNCPIYVPSGSVNAYKNAWSTYASRIQAIV